MLHCVLQVFCSAAIVLYFVDILVFNSAFPVLFAFVIFFIWKKTNKFKMVIESKICKKIVL